MAILKKAFDEKNITSTDHRFFRSGFGVSPKVCGKIWSEMDVEYHNLSAEHLLWALHFLKVYSTETVLAGTVGVSEKTYRETVFKVIDSISIMSENTQLLHYHLEL